MSIFFFHFPYDNVENDIFIILCNFLMPSKPGEELLFSAFCTNKKYFVS